MRGASRADGGAEYPRVVDLTQPLGPDTILWPGTPAFEADADGTLEADGEYTRTLRLAEHSGTHLDAPAHFASNGATAAELTLAQLIRPAVRFDVRELCAGDPNFTLSRAQLEELEKDEGVIPTGSAVLIWTGWDDYLEDPNRYLGLSSGALAFPGIGVGAAELIVEREAAGIGIDSMGIDPGHAGDFPVHQLTLPAGLWHLEGLVNLGGIPPRGAWIVAAIPPIVDGSGAPARAFVILP